MPLSFSPTPTVKLHRSLAALHLRTPPPMLRRRAPRFFRKDEVYFLIKDTADKVTFGRQCMMDTECLSRTKEEDVKYYFEKMQPLRETLLMRTAEERGQDEIDESLIAAADEVLMNRAKDMAIEFQGRKKVATVEDEQPAASGME